VSLLVQQIFASTFKLPAGQDDPLSAEKGPKALVAVVGKTAKGCLS
jgi:hypothetical protein